MLVITHNDLDGWAAGAIAALSRPVEIRHYGYGWTPPTFDQLLGRDVAVLDFSFPLDEMLRIVRDARSLVWLDHHATAIPMIAAVAKAGATVIVDPARCGAYHAWQHFFPGSPVPRVVEIVDDHDRWQYLMPGTREIKLAIELVAGDHNRKAEFGANWPGWPALLSGDEDALQQLQDDGRVLAAAQDSRVRHRARSARRVRIPVLGDVPVMAVEATSDLSETGQAIYREYPKAAVLLWMAGSSREDGPYLSLSFRSGPEGPDVSVLAQKFGGGGHPRAAGAKVRLEADAISVLLKPEDK